MSKWRSRVRMDEDKIWDFISSQNVVQLATLDRDGAPHMTTVWFVVMDERIVFQTNYKSQKVRNIERDGRVSLLFGEGVRHHEQQGVMIKGQARVIRDREQVLEIIYRTYVNRMGGLPRTALRAAASHMVEKHVAVVVKPLSFLTWDHTRLGD